VEHLDQQGIQDIRVHDAPSLSLKFLQRVGVEMRRTFSTVIGFSRMTLDL